MTAAIANPPAWVDDVAMKLIVKLALSYAVVTSVAAHVLALGILLARPQWVEKALASLAPDRVHGIVADAEAAERAAPPVPPWQPDMTGALPPGEIRLSGRPMPNLYAAAKQLRDGDTLSIGPGVYRKGFFIHADNVTLEGRGHVVFQGGAVGGKGTFVIAGNNTTVRNIECHGVAVRDRNGACVRLEGQNLILEHVYFHDSEQGLLTGNKPGLVRIGDSRFDRLGKDGHAHGIYVNGGDLEIYDSLFLRGRNEGHEIKSRARSTLIERTTVASLYGVDSRLLDISQGGSLTVRQSVLEEGPRSANGDMIGFALEKRPYGAHRIELTDNVFILDSKRATRILHQGKNTPEPVARGNVIIGTEKAQFAGVNLWLETRADANLPPYPALPPVPDAKPGSMR